MAHSDLLPLVESVSRTVAGTKHEMAAFLASMQRNWAEEPSPPEQQQDILEARALLDKSQDLPTFLSQYRALVGGMATTEQPQIVEPSASPQAPATSQRPNSQSSPQPDKPSQPSSGGTRPLKFSSKRRGRIG